MKQRPTLSHPKGRGFATPLRSRLRETAMFRGFDAVHLVVRKTICSADMVTSSPLKLEQPTATPAEIAGSTHGSAEIIPFKLPGHKDGTCQAGLSSDEVKLIMRCVDVKLRTPCVLKVENFYGEQGCKVVKVAQLVTNSWHDAN